MLVGLLTLALQFYWLPFFSYFNYPLVLTSFLGWSLFGLFKYGKRYLVRARSPLPLSIDNTNFWNFISTGISPVSKHYAYEAIGAEPDTGETQGSISAHARATAYTLLGPGRLDSEVTESNFIFGRCSWGIYCEDS
jgi:hypothetical protein